jgi:hypothetical protein
MKRVLILILAVSTLAAARDKKAKAQPGPYVFISKASAQTLKVLIVQANLREGYTLDSDNQLQFRFSKPAQMPVVDAIFTASSMCKGMTTKKVWSYTLVELNGTTKVTVEPVWEYPDDYCQTQTQVYMEPARGDCGISSDARQGSHFEWTGSNSSYFHFYSNFGCGSAAARETTCGLSGIGERQSQHHLQVSPLLS